MNQYLSRGCIRIVYLHKYMPKGLEIIDIKISEDRMESMDRGMIPSRLGQCRFAGSWARIINCEDRTGSM